MRVKVTDMICGSCNKGGQNEDMRRSLGQEAVMDACCEGKAKKVEVKMEELAKQVYEEAVTGKNSRKRPKK